jgi:hypothetical protein
MSASTTKIPAPLLPVLVIGAIPMIYIAASPNYETLLEFGNRLYGESLAWTLPAATIGYELLATVTYFLIPNHLTAIRRTAAIGAVAGFVLTVVLAMTWVIIVGGSDVELKVMMKLVPSAVVAGYLHLVVTVWHAKSASAKQEEETPLPADFPAMLPPVQAGPTPEDIAAIVARHVEAAFAEFSAELRASMDKRPPARQAPRPVAKRPVATPPEPISTAPAATPVATLSSIEDVEIARQEDALALFQEELAALPETTPATQEPGNEVSLEDLPYDELRKLLPPGLSAAPRHIELAKKIVREAGDAHGDIKSGKILKHFHGISERQVRNALKIAKIVLGLEELPTAV